MDVIVFAGPSLGAPEQRSANEPGFRSIDFRPPAACGDITRAVAEQPQAIALIDGLFETRAAPWHKEILWALAHGIAVFGAASMGAIRAVELEPFGMRGIGDVFRQYRDGLLEEDDEIAVQHGPAETGYVALSEAMVNIRASLTAACEARVLDHRASEALSRTAKALFYKHRTWNLIFANAAESGVSQDTLERLAAWLPENRVDLKMQDAQELVAAMTAWPLAGCRKEAIDFPDTLYFKELRRKILAGL